MHYIEARVLLPSIFEFQYHYKYGSQTRVIRNNERLQVCHNKVKVDMDSNSHL